MVGRGKVKALVDVATGGAEYVERLRAALRATGTERVAAVFLTHWHRDHTDGTTLIHAPPNPKAPIPNPNPCPKPMPDAQCPNPNPP